MIPFPLLPQRLQALALIALATFASPVVAEAQPAGKVFRIGYLSSVPARGRGELLLAAFRQGLRDLGYVEGQNIVIEFRWAAGDYERLPGLAKELIRLHPDLIVSVGGAATARAVKAATTTIPVVFIAADALGSGIVTNLARPGGNMTGFEVFSVDLDAKRLEHLKTILPRVARVAVLWNPGQLEGGRQQKRIEVAARSLGIRLRFLEARLPAQINTAFATVALERPDALVVLTDPMFSSERDRIVDLASETRVPASYELRHFVERGGLMSFGPDTPDIYRRAATYVDKILKGAKPGDLPVEQATKFELVIKMKTAKALGLTISPSLLLRADQIIE